MRRLSARFAGWTLYALVFLACSSTASAQFRPRLNEPTGAEQFHIEASAALWKPSATVVISSESFGIPGTAIDFKRDLGLTDQTLPEFKITLRPGGHHKLRVDVVPMSYTSSTVLTRDVVFNGQRYSVNLPVNSVFDWTAWRFNYEFDFLAKSRYFVGLVIEAKYNDISAHVSSPSPKIDEFTTARFPLPSLGGIARVYVVPSISITGELNLLNIPRSTSNRYHGNWSDVDIYGTVNFTRNVGAQLGFRSIDLGYNINADSGSLTLKGIYFGIVARY